MRERIRDARRVVVKLGSNLFFNDAGAIALDRIFSFIEDIAAARLAGRQMIVVSSGAVALGAPAPCASFHKNGIVASAPLNVKGRAAGRR